MIHRQEWWCVERLRISVFQVDVGVGSPPPGHWSWRSEGRGHAARRTSNWKPEGSRVSASIPRQLSVLLKSSPFPIASRLKRFHQHPALPVAFGTAGLCSSLAFRRGYKILVSVLFVCRRFFIVRGFEAMEVRSITRESGHITRFLQWKIRASISQSSHEKSARKKSARIFQGVPTSTSRTVTPPAIFSVVLGG